MKKEQSSTFKKYIYCFLASMLLFLAVPQSGGGCANCMMEKYSSSEPSFSIGDPAIKPYRKIVRKPNIWRPGRYW